MTNLPDLWRDFDRPFGLFGSWRPLLRQLDEMMSDNVTPSTSAVGETRTHAPAVDVEESDDHFLLSFDMPGLERDNIDVEVTGNRLIVTGECRHETQGDKGKRHFVERRHGKFQRVLTLPEGVSADKVEAQYVNGVLSVTIPKAAEGKPQKIRIGDGNGKGAATRIESKTTPNV